MPIEYDDIRVCPYDGLPVMCDGDCENCEDCEDGNEVLFFPGGMNNPVD